MQSAQEHGPQRSGQDVLSIKDADSKMLKHCKAHFKTRTCQFWEGGEMNSEVAVNTSSQQHYIIQVLSHSEIPSTRTLSNDS